MGLISGITKAIKNAVSKVTSSSSSSSSKSSSSSSKSSSSSSKSSSSSSSGYYDANKDYAAAIAKATSTAEKNKLIAERQNKIDAMNSSGTNTGGYSNNIYTGGSGGSSSNPISSGGGTSDARFNTIKNMYSNVSYDKNMDYDKAIAEQYARFGSEPYHIVQSEIERLDNQRYAKMLATGQVNASNYSGYQTVTAPKNVNYGQYTPDYYERLLNDTASATGAVGANTLMPQYGDTSGLFPSYDYGYQQQQPDYTQMFNQYNQQMQNMLATFQKQQESSLNSLKQANNYTSDVSKKTANGANGIYNYDNASYKGGQGANIKKSNAVSKYLANSAFKEGKFNQGV